MPVSSRKNPFLDYERTLKSISGYRKVLPASPAKFFRLTLEITKYCSIGCAHCKYSAPPPLLSRKRGSMFLSEEAIEYCLSLIRDYGIRQLVITGGGEPTHEIGGVCSLIQRAEVSEVSLYTAGQWGLDEKECRDHLERFSKSVSTSNIKKKLKIRLSLDDFHAAKIGIRHIARIIENLIEKQNELPNVYSEIRTIQNYETSVFELAGLLGGTYQKISEFEGSVTTRAGIAIRVDRKNLIPMGRQKRRGIEDCRPTSLWSNLAGMQSVEGPGWPVWFGGGLNLGVRPSGKLYLYGGSPENFGRISQKSVGEILDELLRDPVNVGVTLLGLPKYFNLIEYCAPELAANAFDTCEPSILMPIMCAQPRDLLLAKLVAIWAVADEHLSTRKLLAQVVPNAKPDQTGLYLIKQAYEEAMTKKHQKIGNIIGSKEINLKQSASGGSEQEIGDIYDSQQVNVFQEILHQERDELLALGNWILSIPDSEKEEIARQLRDIIITETGDQKVDSYSIAQVARAHLPDSILNTGVGNSIRDAASAVSLVSGAIAVSMISNPLLLAIAIPATLAFTGVLQKDQLTKIFRKAFSITSPEE